MWIDTNQGRAGRLLVASDPASARLRPTSQYTAHTIRQLVTPPDLSWTEENHAEVANESFPSPSHRYTDLCFLLLFTQQNESYFPFGFSRLDCTVVSESLLTKIGYV
jgi:hypothetical protein